MDTSNYPKSHVLYRGDRKNVTGFLKNETPELRIVSFVGLRSKCYAMDLQQEVDELIHLFSELKNIGFESEEGERKTLTRAKGVKTHVRQKVKFEIYLSSLFDMTEIRATQFNLLSKTHTNMLVKQKKIAFSPFDAKRALTCLIHSTPYGSCFLKYREKTGKCYACEHPDDLF